MPIEMKATSHSLQSLLAFMGREFANKFAKTWEFEDGSLSVFVRDKYMLRNNQTLTVTVTVESRIDHQDAVITIVAAGGREGFLRLDMWGAENAAEKWAQKEIQSALYKTDGQSYTTRESPSRRPME